MLLQAGLLQMLSIASIGQLMAYFKGSEALMANAAIPAWNEY
jgi:hypothetical protein